MAIGKILEYILDLILPRPQNVRVLEAMSPEKFRTATRGSGINDASTPENTITVFDYKNPLVRQAIWELKYRGNSKVAVLLAQCLHEELAEELAERKAALNFSAPILIPVPLSKKRLRERGFNQCELLADALETVDGGNFFEVRRDLLIKVRDTESQTKKNRTARLKNLENCFAVKTPTEISGRNIILLDDVITTGATVDEARRTLKRAGARKVLCVAVAH